MNTVVVIFCIYFNPRPPRGGRLLAGQTAAMTPKFQSTPPARGATRRSRHVISTVVGISIHAPREGGDHRHLRLCGTGGHFNPRPPRGGRRPAWHRPPASSISIHAPREGGDSQSILLKAQRGISIHAPREGGDGLTAGAYHVNLAFQSTPPARGATLVISTICTELAISIHAPREGGDRNDAVSLHKFHRFQSTPPARGATRCGTPGPLPAGFQSTPPARGATRP